MRQSVLWELCKFTKNARNQPCYPPPARANCSPDMRDILGLRKQDLCVFQICSFVRGAFAHWKDAENS